MSDPAEGIKGLLVSAGVGFNFVSGVPTDWEVHLGQFPAKPDAVLLCMSVGGSAPNPKWLLNRPSVQILVRGKVSQYSSGRTKAQEVMDALLGLPSQDIGSDRWVAVNAAADIVSLGFDELERPIWSLNFNLIIEPSSGTYRQSM